MPQIIPTKTSVTEIKMKKSVLGEKVKEVENTKMKQVFREEMKAKRKI